MAKRRVGVEYSPSMLVPVRLGAVSPDRALCLPTFIHFLIVSKTSLFFLSLSLSSFFRKGGREKGGERKERGRTRRTRGERGKGRGR